MGKRAKIPIFQTLNAFFYIWGCCDKKYIFKNVSQFKRRFFWYQTYLVTTPPSGFFAILTIFFSIYLTNNYFLIFLGVYTPSIKIWEIICQTWPLQTPFSQHTHSDALVAFVWPEHIARKFSLTGGDEDTFRSF